MSSGCRHIRCAGRHFARIGIAHVIAGNNALDAGDLKVKRLLAAVCICVGKIGLAVCGIVLSFHKALSGGVELYKVAYRVCICSGVAVSRNNRITEGPLICIFHADILVGSRHIDILTGRVGNLETGGETAGDLLGYCLKGFVEFHSIVGVIGVGLILACSSCYGVAEESSDRGAAVICFIIGSAEADSIQLGSLLQLSCGSSCSIIDHGAAFIGIAVCACTGGRAIRQSNNIFRVSAYRADRRIGKLIFCLCETLFKVCAAVIVVAEADATYCVQSSGLICCNRYVCPPQFDGSVVVKKNH